MGQCSIWLAPPLADRLPVSPGRVDPAANPLPIPVAETRPSPTPQIDRRRIVSTKLICPACQARLKLTGEQVPANVTCPRCQHVFPPQVLTPVAVAPPQALPSPAPDTSPPVRDTGYRVAPPAERTADDNYGVLRPPEPEPTPQQLETKRLPPAPMPQDLTPAESSELIRQLLAGFQGQVVQRRPGWGYRLGALGAALGLCVLLLIYAATVAAIPLGAWWYFTRVLPQAAHVPGRLMVWGVVLHCGIGVALLGFLYALLRPLFRWHARGQVPLQLPSAEHPVLHAFVAAIARQVGAPIPHQIHLQPQANASAIRHGGELLLSLGGPLFLALDLKSMAGVIAHELGHFSQTGASWISSFVRRMTNWLLEAVSHTSSVSDSVGDVDPDSGRAAMVLAFVIRGTMWLGRMYLLGLAAAALSMSRFLTRRQEFDADRYPIQLAGSAQFAVTMRRLLELNVAEERFLRMLMRELPLDLTPAKYSREVVAHAAALDDRAQRQVGRLLAPQSASWWETHPSPADRIAAAAQLQHPGIVQLAGPASCLLNRGAFERLRFGR